MTMTSPGTPTSGKDKVMIYVPAEVRRAMRVLAAERGCPVSGIYVEAAREYLEARGRSVREQPEPSGSASGTAPGIEPPDLMERLGQMAEAIALVLAKLEEPGTLRQPDSMIAKPRTAKMADDMQTILRALAKAGPSGLSTAELRMALQRANVASGNKKSNVRSADEVNAKSALMRAGLMRHEARRWFLGPEGPTNASDD